MGYIKRSIAVILILGLVLTSGITSEAQELIYQNSEKKIITSGVTLEKITRFNDEGWLKINVMRVDTSNPNVSLDTLTSSESVAKLTTTKDLALGRGAVAAINGGFFNWSKQAGTAYPEGVVVEDGKLLSLPNQYNAYDNLMATFSMDQYGKSMMQYIKTNLIMVAPTGNYTPVGQYNKPSYKDFNDVTILDRRWGSKSVGASTQYPDITELVVKDGILEEIRKAQPAVEIPENGFVVVTRAQGAKFFESNYKIGDKVTYTFNTTPDYKALKMAITGSTVLVKDGKVFGKFSLDIKGRHPRTAVGTSQSGKELILVTVDGRQQSSIGMTQAELADLMISLGSYNAINFDGGGSTAMVARKLGTDDLYTENSPSDGSLRKVATAMGIFSLASPSGLSGLVVEADDTNVFVNTSRTFRVMGYDENFNPVDLTQEDIKWSVEGVEGTFEGNRFYPKSVGEGKIKAALGDITGECPVSVLSGPAVLSISEPSVKMQLNQKKTFGVTGKNINGFKAVINPEDLTWKVLGDIGTISGPVFASSGKGAGFIDVSIGNVHAYSSVVVAEDSSSIKDGFEKNNGTFQSSPADIGGSYEISDEQAKTGDFSGKLSYDFTKLEGTRAAYMVLPDNGLTLEPNTVKLGVWVYNDHENSNWLRGEISDAKGNKTPVDFCKELNWTGWKYIEANIGGISQPSKLLRLYLVQVSPVSDSGAIYLDDLTFVKSFYPSIDAAKIPKDTVPKDPDNKSAVVGKVDDAIRFSVFGQSGEPKNLLETILVGKLKNKLSGLVDTTAFIGNSKHEIASSFKQPSVSTGTGYKAYDINKSRFLQLDTSKQGIRETDPNEWRWLKKQLDTSGDIQNIFIFAGGSPLEFKDKMESVLFQDTLTELRKQTGKNIWVFYNGPRDESFMERGVKYISTAGYSIQGLNPGKADQIRYVLVTVKGGEATYEFKPLL